MGFSCVRTLKVGGTNTSDVPCLVQPKWNDNSTCLLGNDFFKISGSCALSARCKSAEIARAWKTVNRAPFLEEEAAEFFNEKQYSQAVRCLTAAIALAPSEYRFYQKRAQAQGVDEKLPRAFKIFCVLRLNPNYEPALRLRATSYFEMRNYIAALADCTKAISICPSDSQAYRFRAYVYAKLGKRTSAIVDCKSALKINPQEKPASMLLSQLTASKK